jgi:hypothetical protein
MVRVHHVKKARKHYPRAGIKRGQPYFWISTKRAGKFTGKLRFASKPRRSQLTGSAYLRAIYVAREALEDAAVLFNTAVNEAVADGYDGPEADEAGREEALGKFADVLGIAAEAVFKAGEACATNRENMPERLRQSANSDLLERRAEACGRLVDALNAAAEAVRMADVADIRDGFAGDKLGELDWSEVEE